jgi:transglutaminase-like putative cysteine protease
VLDHDTLEWENVAVATYHIQQCFIYEYPGPIFDLSHRLVVLPPAVHADQRRLSGSLTVSPHAPAHSRGDAFGNDVVTFSLERVERAFEIEVEATVRRSRRSAEHSLTLDAAAYAAYRESTPLTAPDDALLHAAARLRSRYACDRDLAEAIVAFVHDALAYTKGVTSVETTAATAFQTRRGVCQDFAHVALSLARACGLAARYVSGHLLGEGATHAWIEFLLPAAGEDGIALSYDPTYGTRTSLRYVVVAVGRDYGDVAPTSGAYRAPYAGTLNARTHVRVGEIIHRA